MSIQATDDTSAAQAQRSAPRGERRPGERETADFERALHKAGRSAPTAGDEEDDALPRLPDALPAPDTVRSAAAATLPARRPTLASGSDESRPEPAGVTPPGAVVHEARPAPMTIEPARGLLPSAAPLPARRPTLASGGDESRLEPAGVTPPGAGMHDVRPAPMTIEPARGLLPSAAMQDALRAAAMPAASATKESVFRIELPDARAPLQHIALQRSASGALDVQLGADARLRTPLAASADKLRARLAERGASLASIALEGTDGLDTTDEN